jgi:hypothetical protein
VRNCAAMPWPSSPKDSLYYPMRKPNHSFFNRRSPSPGPGAKPPKITTTFPLQR